MAIKQLNEEQIRTWTLEQKDRWWLENVFRGNMPQLTIRAALTGFILGGLLSATNLYIGARTGWSLGVGLTSVILAFAMFKVLSSLRLSKDFTILENNCMQSIATAAGYMTGPLISGIAAYMMVSNTIMPWWQMLLLNIVLAVLGVLVAFPMKRRFINDEQHPFPEGAACGVVLDTLYTSDANVGLFKAKALGLAALIASFVTFIAGEGYQTLLQVNLLRMKAAHYISLHLDGWYYALAEKGTLPIPTIFGSDIRKLGLSPAVDLAMFGAGGLLNIRYAASMIIGMAIMWGWLAPLAVMWGDVTRPLREADASGRMVSVGVETITPDMAYNYREVLVSWALWPGIAMLVVASMLALFAKPKMIISAFTGLFNREKAAKSDVLGHIEFPLWISLVGVPVVGAIGVWMIHAWFGVSWYWGALSIPLIIALTLIAANATALTSITPTGSLSKITQFTFGGLERATALKAGAVPNPDDRAYDHGGRGKRVKPPHGHQTGIHARRQTPAAGHRTLHRHHCWRGSLDAALLRAVSAEQYRRQGHDRPALNPAVPHARGTAVEGRERPSVEGIRRTSLLSTLGNGHRRCARTRSRDHSPHQQEQVPCFADRPWPGRSHPAGFHHGDVRGVAVLLHDGPYVREEGRHLQQETLGGHARAHLCRNHRRCGPDGYLRHRRR
jgi:hypothetical protein